MMICPAIDHARRRTSRGARLVRLRRAALWLPAVMAVATVVFGKAPGRAIELTSPVDADPYFAPLRESVTLPPGTIELWIKALNEPRLDGRLEACHAAIRAHRLGVDLAEHFKAPFRRLLDDRSTSPVVIRAIAAAASQLELSELAPELMTASATSGRDGQRIIETALANWEYQPMGPVWQARLADSASSRQDRMLAYYGLQRVPQLAAVSQLLKFMGDPTRDFAERAAAARAAAVYDSPQRIVAARNLAQGDAQDRRLAALLLTTATGDEARRLRLALAEDDDQPAATLAMKSLLKLNAAASVAPAGRWIESGTAQLRLLAVEAYARNASAEAVERLLRFLDDPHPAVRRAAADALATLARSDALRDHVIRLTNAGLERAASPRELEQYVLIAGTIGDASASTKLMELLRCEEDAVSIAASWALAKLALPQTREPLAEELRRMADAAVRTKRDLAPQYAVARVEPIEIPDLRPLYAKAEFLIVALGKLRDRDAADVLIPYVAKPTPQVRGEPPNLELHKQDRLRAAAIWALGRVFEDSRPEPPLELVTALTERMADTTPIPPEADLVRQMSAVCLARMNRQETTARLEEFFDPDAESYKVGRACGWALGRLTGTEPERSLVKEVRRIDWFLIPINEAGP